MSVLEADAVAAVLAPQKALAVFPKALTTVPFLFSTPARLVWRYQSKSPSQGSAWFVSSPSFNADDSVVYFGSWDGKLYALATQPDVNGTAVLLWAFETGGRISSTAAVGPDGSVYFGSNDHFVYCLAPDGGLRWKYDTQGEVLSSPALSSAGVVVIGSNSHVITALRPNGTLLWQRTTGNWVTASPVIGNDGAVYVPEPLPASFVLLFMSPRRCCVPTV